MPKISNNVTHSQEEQSLFNNCLNERNFMKLLINYFLAGSSMLFASALSASQVSDTMRAQYAPGPTIETTAKSPSGNLTEINKVIPTPLQQYVTPTLAKDPEFIQFLVNHEQLWKEKQALMEKDPKLKELANKHLHLKKQLLNLKKKGPEYQTFFEHAFEFWINRQ